MARKSTRNRIARPDADTIKSAAAGRWREIIAAVGHCPADYLDGSHHPCPRCGGTDRFRLINADAGAVLCNQCFHDKNGDGLAALAWLRGWSFTETLTNLAEYLGLSPAGSVNGNGHHHPNGHANGHVAATSGKPPANPEEHLQWKPWSSNIAQVFFCRAKRGVTVEALEAFGARLAKYRGRFDVVALPVRSPDASIIGWLIWEQSGKTLPAYHGRNKPATQEKMLLTAGSRTGLIAPTAFFDAAKRPSRLWKVEGPTDALALWSKIDIDADPGQHPAAGIFTNSNGARQNPLTDWLPLVAGRELVIIHDADQPGEDGAAKWGRAAAPLENTVVRNPKLPYPIEVNHGKDLRDWLNDGNTFDSLLALASAAPPIVADALPPLAVVEAEDDPHRLARLFLAEQPGPILYWRCDYYRWSGECYRRLSDEQFLSELTATIKKEFDRLNLFDQEDGATGENGAAKECRQVTSAKVGNARLAVNSLTIVQGDAEPPSWLPEKAGAV